MGRRELVVGSAVAGGLVLYYLLRRAKAVPTPPVPPVPTCFVESVRISASKEVVTEGEEFVITCEVLIAGEPPEEGADLLLKLFVNNEEAFHDTLKVTRPDVIVINIPFRLFLEGTYRIYATAKIIGTDIEKKSNEVVVEVTKPGIPPAPPTPPPPYPPILPTPPAEGVTEAYVELETPSTVYTEGTDLIVTVKWLGIPETKSLTVGIKRPDGSLLDYVQVPYKPEGTAVFNLKPRLFRVTECVGALLGIWKEGEHIAFVKTVEGAEYTSKPIYFDIVRNASKDVVKSVSVKWDENYIYVTAEFTEFVAVPITLFTVLTYKVFDKTFVVANKLVRVSGDKAEIKFDKGCLSEVASKLPGGKLVAYVDYFGVRTFSEEVTYG